MKSDSLVNEHLCFEEYLKISAFLEMGLRDCTVLHRTLTWWCWEYLVGCLL